MLEMNFARLLHHTEDLASSDRAHEARFASYLKALRQFYSELSESKDRPAADYVRHYESRLKQLEVARDMSLSTTSEERASFFILPTSPLIPIPVQDDLFIISPEAASRDQSALDSSEPKAYVRGYLDQPPHILRLEQQRMAKTNRDLLLGTGKLKTGDDYVASQPGSITSTLSPEAQRQSRSHLVHDEELRREQLASEMLHMAAHLKQQSSAIGERLQADRQVVEVTVEQADRTTADMSVVLHQLSEELGSRCARVVWVALFVALIIFFQMIAFMKIFRKRIIVYSSPSRTEL